MRTYKTIDEIRAANEAGGYFFFHPWNMKTMRSSIEAGPVGNLFVTGDQPVLSLPRAYTVRRAEADGYVTTLEERPTLEEAVALMAEFA